MIDFHCHIDLYPDPRDVLAEAHRRGLYLLSVTTTPSAWTETNRLAAGCSRTKTALGLHPQLAHERIVELPLFVDLLPRVSFVGEIGLDGAPEFRKHWDRQLTAFDAVLDACARVGGRVLTIHSRRAATHVLDRLQAFPGAGTPILHWFTGTFKELERAIQLGCWFSVGTPMLLSNNGRDLITRIPADRVLTESDGPFAQVGGRALLPWDVATTIEMLGALWRVSPDDAALRLRANLCSLLAASKVKWPEASHPDLA